MLQLALDDRLTIGLRDIAQTGADRSQHVAWSVRMCSRFARPNQLTLAAHSCNAVIYFSVLVVGDFPGL